MNKLNMKFEYIYHDKSDRYRFVSNTELNFFKGHYEKGLWPNTCLFYIFDSERRVVFNIDTLAKRMKTYHGLNTYLFFDREII